MFLDGNQKTADYYYRPSMVAFDHSQNSAAPVTTLHGLGQAGTSPSGKTVQDFLPRDWFDSSVYRNILDMINTLEVTRQNLYHGALGQFINVRRLPNMVRGELRPGYVCHHKAELQGPHPLAPTLAPERKAFWGWAHKQTPAGDSTIVHFVHKKIFECGGTPKGFVQDNFCVRNALKNAGYLADSGGNYGVTCPKGARNSAERHNARVKAGMGYTSQDIVNLVRSLDWEMNRVHLPLPFNLRQWATRYSEFSLDNTGIGWAQRVYGLRDLQKWIVIMREKIRKAIDASNLTLKVAEESLRKENAAIIKERAEERKIREEKRKIEIQQERIAAEKLIDAERKRLVDEMRARSAATRKRAMEAAQREIEQAKVAPVPPVAVKPEVTPAAPVPAPVPKPTPVFVQPAVTAPVPVVAPTPVTPPKETNWLPLIIGGVTAVLFMS